VTPAIQVLMREVERIRDDFVRAVFVDGDLDAAVQLLGPDVVLSNVPAGTGATGIDAVRRHLTTDVIGHVPADLQFSRVSRTVDRIRLVDEQRVSFTHDRVLPWLLPGVEPTGRAVDVLAVTVAVVRQGRLAAHRTLWDQTALPNPPNRR
jgi:carboxymethylenebutenolidase